MFYANKLLILGQDVLVRICSKVNDDKMVMNIFWEWSQRRCKPGGLKKVWQDGDENLKT